MKKVLSFALVTFGVFAAVAACSSSSSNGGGGGGGAPSCQNPSSTGAGSTACNSCLQTHCSAELSSVQASCSAYIACYQGCQCSDLACLLNCVSTKIDATCQNAVNPESTCMQNNCKSDCTTTVHLDGGGGG